MADETNKEILEEIGEDVTEGTQTEGTTEGTQTEGTTGNGYLTKHYLVRNLQTFWSKIKQYIINQKFVNESYVDGALVNTASKEALTSLGNIVNGKAEQSEFKALEQLVESKADKSALDDKVNKDGDKVLSTHDFETKYKDQLDNLELATETEDGLMSCDDKQKLDDLVVNAVKTVDNALSTTSTNPVQNKIIKEELDKKVDKENLQDSSDLIRLGNLTGYATDEGHIVLNFPNRLTHFKIYTPNSDRPIEKISLRNNSEVLFTTFQEESGSWAVTIENPEGKEGDNWKISFGESFNFYVEDFVLDNSKYKPFILNAERSNIDDLNEITLNITKVFEL